MPNFHRFDGYRLDVRSRDHNPPHFHVIGPDFHAMIKIVDLSLMRGAIPRRILAEVVEWASAHIAELSTEWERLNERD